MKQIIGLAGVVVFALGACSEAPEQVEVTTASKVTSMEAKGTWIKDKSGNVMADPQTSALTVWEGKLVSLSDASAGTDMQRRLHFIDPQTATVTSDEEKMRIGTTVRRSCFSGYLADAPDLEALVADPAQPGVFYTVTEDATRTGALSVRCQQRYQNTGSTDYPSLLVRLERHEFGTTMTGVRPLQFPLSLKVGDYPNDGIEGLAMSADNTLYLGLEKDAAGQPRIFSLTLNDDFWDTTDFVPVEDPGLAVPVFDSGNHPLNGLAWYAGEGEQGYLLASARNDNELWVISTDPEKETKRIPLHFTAPASGDNCSTEERMDNASIEGLTVLGNTLYLVNDPWKENYLKNIQCDSNKARYEAMAPLLFSLPLDPAWFN